MALSLIRRVFLADRDSVSQRRTRAAEDGDIRHPPGWNESSGLSTCLRFARVLVETDNGRLAPIEFDDVEAACIQSELFRVAKGRGQVRKNFPEDHVVAYGNSRLAGCPHGQIKHCLRGSSPHGV